MFFVFPFHLPLPSLQPTVDDVNKDNGRAKEWNISRSTDFRQHKKVYWEREW